MTMMSRSPLTEATHFVLIVGAEQRGSARVLAEAAAEARRG